MKYYIQIHNSGYLKVLNYKIIYYIIETNIINITNVNIYLFRKQISKSLVDCQKNRLIVFIYNCENNHVLI